VPERSSPTPVDADGTGAVRYSERLWVPVWWWPIAFGITALLAAEIDMGVRAVPGWLPFLLLAPVPIWVLMWLSRLRVEVVIPRDAVAELMVGRAHLPVDVIARAAGVPGSAKSAALGRQLDPAAYVQHRAWIRQMILVVLDDPDDPTPYWLVSTRRPDRLLAALNDAGAAH
jgi:Protein of unknown function (DUF3093)